ncbi:hypothetical protein BJ742DRAFT_90023 [Cladochytrium replicatum]|nr:hypothetical protein BJ742DRAFT_90023 [Cladochytrium replicatum]
MSYNELMKNTFGRGMKTFCSDGGRGFKALYAYFRFNGILHIPSMADAHQQNGIAECHNRTLEEKARTIRAESGLRRSQVCDWLCLPHQRHGRRMEIKQVVTRSGINSQRRIHCAFFCCN